MSRPQRGKAHSAFQPVRTLPIRLRLAHAAGSGMRLEYEAAEEDFGQHTAYHLLQIAYAATTMEVFRWSTMVTVLLSCDDPAPSLWTRAG